MNDYREWPGALTAVLLILAIFSLPYGYYTFLRWVVTAASIYVAYYLSESKDNKLWIFVGLAVLFNPIAPIYSTKSFWVIVYLISAGLFLAFSKKQVIKETRIDGRHR